MAGHETLKLALSRRREPFKPLATLILCAAFMGIHTLVTCRLDKSFLLSFGFCPANPWRKCGLTLVTALFLHQGWIHLCVNIAGTIMWGVLVEHLLGWWGCLSVFMLAGLAGAAAHRIWDSPPGYCVGASGGILGLWTFYALSFRRLRLDRSLIHLKPWFDKLRNNPIQRLKGRWLSPQMSGKCRMTLLQSVSGALTFELVGLSRVFPRLKGITSVGHIGGALCGAACYGIWRSYKSYRRRRAHPRWIRA